MGQYSTVGTPFSAGMFVAFQKDVYEVSVLLVHEHAPLLIQFRMDATKVSWTPLVQ